MHETLGMSMMGDNKSDICKRTFIWYFYENKRIESSSKFMYLSKKFFLNIQLDKVQSALQDVYVLHKCHHMTKFCP